MDRSRYLEIIWKNSYPSSQSRGASIRDEPKTGNWIVSGRILEINKDKIRISQNGYERYFTLGRNIIETSVLTPGDIVDLHCACYEQTVVTEINLLVPSREETPFAQNLFNKDTADKWQRFVSLVRNYFESKNFTELRTPTLVSSPGLEPHLDPFETNACFGRVQNHCYLPTSPEFHLKKALTLGFTKIFEFKECFRNSEFSQTHQPEFQMLEWYRAYCDNVALIKDLQELLKLVQSEFTQSRDDVVVVKMEELWGEVLDFKLTPQTQKSELIRICTINNIEFSNSDDFDDLFNRIFLERIEPPLANRPEPLIILNFPPSQAALARLTDDGWADRFELYWRGLEIANAFHELNDVTEQRKRFLEAQSKKQELGKKAVPVDEEFMRALEWGMPPSAGIALGMDRLFMAVTGIKDIRDTRLFPMNLE